MQKKRVSIWTAFVVVIVLLSLIIVYIQGQSGLDAPTGAAVTNASTTQPTEKIDLETFTDKENHYTVGIPMDWKKVIKDGFNTFVHSPSATSLQIQTTSYSPFLLTVTAESISAELGAEGYAVSDFTWYSSTSYAVVYQKQTEDATQIFAETTYFDRTSVLRLVFTVKSEYADRMMNTIAAIVDSFVWDPQNPFPDGVKLYYSQYGNYEFAYPAEWNTAVSGNTYMAQDSKTGATMSIMATKSQTTYETFSKLDYTSFASKGRSSFVLQNYSADKNIIYAQSSYMANDTPMVLIQYLVASGTYEYALTFEIPQAAFQTQSAMVQDIINTIRFFN